MSSAAGFDSDTCRALCRDGRAPIPKFTRVRAAGWPCSLKQDSNIMHANSYMIPAPRGLIRVNADGGIAAEVAAEIRNFKANFEAWKQKHGDRVGRSEEHTSELQSLMRTSYAVFCLKKKNKLIKLITSQIYTHILAKQ